MVVGLLMVAGGFAAGLFGSLLGLGGGVLIVPLMTLGFGLPLHQAVGVSLVCVIMTSSAASGVYLERHLANLRLGMTLELFTAVGALVGGSIAFLLDERVLEGLFGVVLALRGGHDARRRECRTGRCRDAADGHASDRADHGRSPLRRGLSDPPPRARRGWVDRGGRSVCAVRHRRRHHQGAGHAPRDGRPAAGRHGHQQPDDRRSRHPRAPSSTWSAARSTPTSRVPRASGCSSGRRSDRGSRTGSTRGSCASCSRRSSASRRSRCG